LKDPGDGLFFVFKGSLSYIQNSYKPKDPKDVPLLLKNMKKVMVGLRIYTDGINLYKREGDEPIFRIPENIQTCREANDFMSKKHTLPFTDALCSIGYNSKLVCFNTHHLCCDATVSKMFAKQCLDENFEANAEYPVSAAAVFKDVIQKYMPNLEKYKDHIVPDEMLSLITPDGRDSSPGNDLILNEFPVTDLQCYNHKLKKPIGLTNSIWAASSLSINALSNDFRRYGIYTAFNIRPFLKESQNSWKHLNQFTALNVIAKNPSMSLTIKELGEEFRKHFNFLKNHGLVFDKFVHNYRLTYPYGCFFAFSSLGPIVFHEKLDDVCFTANCEGIGFESFIGYNNYCKIKKGSNIFCSNLKFPWEALTRKKAQILNDSINHLLCDVPLDTKLSEVIPELQNYQQKLYKEY